MPEVDVEGYDEVRMVRLDDTQDLLAVLGRPTLGYFGLLAAAAGSMLFAGALWTYQVYIGLGIAGYTHPVFWGVYIVTFVFWVGIAHAGTLISAILYLFRARWRNAINRGAEAMTVFAVLTAAQFLGIHVGRLNDDWNFPLGVRVAPSGLEPFLLHHHAAFENGRLLDGGHTARTRDAIARVNGAIDAFSERVRAFPLDVRSVGVGESGVRAPPAIRSRTDGQ